MSHEHVIAVQLGGRENEREGERENERRNIALHGFVVNNLLGVLCA